MASNPPSTSSSGRDAYNIRAMTLDDPRADLMGGGPPTLYHRGHSRNGTERFPSPRMLRIVPSYRRLRFDRPPFFTSAVGNPAIRHLLDANPRSASATLLHRLFHLATKEREGCYTATAR
jgi:hypothetical protein